MNLFSSYTAAQPSGTLPLGLKMRPFWDILNLLPHEFLKLVGRLRIRRVLVVVLAAVIENEICVFDEILRRKVLVGFEFAFHGAEIHRFFDDFVVISNIVAVDRNEKGPSRVMVLEVVEEMEEVIVVGAVAGLSCQFVHVRGPARGTDGGDVEGIDL